MFTLQGPEPIVFLGGRVEALPGRAIHPFLETSIVLEKLFGLGLDVLGH